MSHQCPTGRDFKKWSSRFPMEEGDQALPPFLAPQLCKQGLMDLLAPVPALAWIGSVCFEAVQRTSLASF
jgi:hypothetical protein